MNQHNKHYVIKLKYLYNERKDINIKAETII